MMSTTNPFPQGFTALEFLKGQGSVMVFDVESMGLHGEPFAFGYVVVNRSGVIAKFRAACPSIRAAGTAEDRQWISANVPTMEVTCDSPYALRESFWSHWMRWKAEAVLAAECPWPVEANFLSACIRDAPQERKWQGPYPLYDISSFLFAAGMNTLETRVRLPDELPAHDPLADSAQSARLMIEAFTLIHSAELEVLERS
jgi:hypothetical protein